MRGRWRVSRGGDPWVAARRVRFSSGAGFSAAARARVGKSDTAADANVLWHTSLPAAAAGCHRARVQVTRPPTSPLPGIKYYTTAQLPELLASSDYIVNILPRCACATQQKSIDAQPMGCAQFDVSRGGAAWWACAAGSAAGEESINSKTWPQSS